MRCLRAHYLGLRRETPTRYVAVASYTHGTHETHWRRHTHTGRGHKRAREEITPRIPIVSASSRCPHANVSPLVSSWPDRVSCYGIYVLSTALGARAAPRSGAARRAAPFGRIVSYERRDAYRRTTNGREGRGKGREGEGTISRLDRRGKGEGGGRGQGRIAERRTRRRRRAGARRRADRRVQAARPVHEHRGGRRQRRRPSGASRALRDRAQHAAEPLHRIEGGVRTPQRVAHARRRRAGRRVEGAAGAHGPRRAAVAGDALPARLARRERVQQAAELLHRVKAGDHRGPRAAEVGAAIPHKAGDQRGASSDVGRALRRAARARRGRTTNAMGANVRCEHSVLHMVRA